MDVVKVVVGVTLAGLEVVDVRGAVVVVGAENGIFRLNEVCNTNGTVDAKANVVGGVVAGDGGVVLDGASEVVVGAGVVVVVDEDGTRGSCGVTAELAAE